MRTRLPIALLLAVTVAIGFQATVPHLPPRWGLAGSDFLIMLAAGYASVSYRRNASGVSGRARATMIVGACSAGMWSLANGLLLLTETSLIGTVGAEAGGLASIVATTLLPVGLILAAAPRRGLAQLRRLLDITAVSGAILILAWQFILAPAAALGDRSSIITALHYIVPESLAAALALVTAASSVPGRKARALHLMAAVAVVLAVTMMLKVHNDMTRSLWYENGVGAGYLLGALLLALASRHVLPTPSDGDVRRLVTSMWAALPYIPVLLAVVAIAMVQVRTGRLGAVLVWLMLGTFCLVLLRQLATLRMVGGMAVVLQEQKVSLAYQAHHDTLTGLPNRAAFQDRGAEAVRDADRVVLLLLDLDGFKAVNDSLGHAAGDEVLVTVARRLAAALRPADIACRLGGDEFAVLVTDVSDDDLTSLPRRILSAVGKPMTIHGTPVTVGVSIGVSSAQPGTGRTLDLLLRQADEAMYDAKAQGKGIVSCHPADDGKITPRYAAVSSGRGTA